MKADTIVSSRLNTKDLYRGETRKSVRTRKNWHDRDRLSWQNESDDLTPTNNTFVRAAIFNTKENNPDRYTTIAERSDYYDVMDALTEVGVLPNKIRFFGAASQVTHSNNVGCIERQIGKMLHSEAAIALLHGINQILFEVNMKMARRLLRNGTIIDPKNPLSTQPIAAIHFDLNMVEMEQGILEDYLRAQLARMPKEEGEKAIRDINRDLNFSGAIGTILKFIANPQPMKWAKEALDVEKLDFLQRKHREAIGKAIVVSLHHTTFEEYKTHIVCGVIPPERLSECYRL